LQIFPLISSCISYVPVFINSRVAQIKRHQFKVLNSLIIVIINMAKFLRR